MIIDGSYKNWYICLHETIYGWQASCTLFHEDKHFNVDEPTSEEALARAKTIIDDRERMIKWNSEAPPS